MSFLPPDYTPPKTGGNYMKFEKGENKFRVLSQKAITGYEYWNHDNKPVRLRNQPTVRPDDIRLKDEKQHWMNSVKHFWAFAVWNYKEEAVQVLEITQVTIQNALMALYQDSEWGHLNKYDIVVVRNGDGLETEYQVMPKPHKALPVEILDAYAAKPVNLEALFDGADPFAVVGVTEEEMINTF